MKKKPRRVIIILFIFVLVVILIIIFTQLEMNNRKNKAIDAAIKYLEDTYTEQMNYKSIRQSLIVEPIEYHVYFYPQDNPNITFQVIVDLDFTLTQKPYYYNSDYQWVPDNYLLKYFDFYFSNEIQQMADAVWDADIRCNTFVGEGMGAYRVSKNLTEYMPFEEMEPYIDYILNIRIEKIYKDEDKHTEAGRILEFIKKIQVSGYSPEEITFFYQSDGEEEHIFSYKYWDEIGDIAQIEEKMN